MKLLRYVVPYDSGLAPNPFGKFCTLALCTPNHMNAKLEFGDWILGHSEKANGNKLIYAMEVTEILNFEEYFIDKRFQYKKPNFKSSWWKVMGDNIYYKDKNGGWKWIRPSLHGDKRKQDTKHSKVFISNNFYYFGENSLESFPVLFPKILQKRHGISYTIDLKEINNFLNWLRKNYETGTSGNKPSLLLNNKTQC